MGRISVLKYGVGIGLMITLFASDLALKRWSTNHLQPFEARPLLGSKTLLLSRHRDWNLAVEPSSPAMPQGEAMTLPYHRIWVPVMWGILALFFVARVRRGETRGFYAFCILLAGGAAQWWSEPIHTLQLALRANRYIPFNLADFYVALGGVGLIFSLALEALGIQRRRADSNLLTFSSPGVLKRYRLR